MRENPVYERAIGEIEREVCLEDTERLYLYVFAPALTEYVRWVLDHAARSGIRRLYFLARDGWQMYLTAKKLSEGSGLSVECRYLQVSRYAMRLPEYHLLGSQCLDRICGSGLEVSFDKIMRRAGLSEAEGLEIAELTGRTAGRGELLRGRRLFQVRKELEQTPEFMEYVFRHSREAFSRAVGYLEQEGLLDGESFALVDSGWIGTLQQSIQNLLRTRRPDIRLCGYYFGLYELPVGAGKEDYHAFYFTPGRHLKRKVLFSNSMFEVIFSSPAGMTLGYEQNGERYQPRLSAEKNPNGMQLQRNITVLEAFLTRELPPLEAPPAYGMLEQLLTVCLGQPGLLEAEAYGGSLFSDDVSEGRLTEIAAELSQKEIRGQRILGKIRNMLLPGGEMLRESAWLEGSIVRNGRHVRRNLRHAAWYKYLIYMRKAWRKL